MIEIYYPNIGVTDTYYPSATQIHQLLEGGFEKRIENVFKILDSVQEYDEAFNRSSIIANHAKQHHAVYAAANVKDKDWKFYRLRYP